MIDPNGGCEGTVLHHVDLDLVHVGEGLKLARRGLAHWDEAVPLSVYASWVNIICASSPACSGELMTSKPLDFSSSSG
jgi:hypothetical protein